MGKTPSWTAIYENKDGNTIQIGIKLNPNGSLIEGITHPSQIQASPPRYSTPKPKKAKAKGKKVKTSRKK